jgi:hypothetical protein
MTNPPAGQPTEPQDAPEKRIRRGCLMIIMLLLIGVSINVLEYRLNIVTIIGGSMLLFAIVGLVVISREGKK